MPGDSRYVHHTSLTAMSAPQAYRQGQQQANLSLERFHYLCAAATESYSIVGEERRDIPFGRQELEFSSYTPHRLKDITDLKLHIPRSDGSIVPGDIDPYVDEFLKDSKCREAGILYCVGEERAFWNMIMNFHSTARTTGIEAWDDLLIRLKLDGPDPGIVPCMVSRDILSTTLPRGSRTSSSLHGRLGASIPSARFYMTKKRVFIIEKIFSLSDVLNSMHPPGATHGFGTSEKQTNCGLANRSYTGLSWASSWMSA